jgi:hypothetical protein
MDELLTKKSADSPSGTTFFVVCSGLTWYIDSTLLSSLTARQQQIRFLLLGIQPLPEFDAPVLSAQIFDPSQEFIGQLIPLN